MADLRETATLILLALLAIPNSLRSRCAIPADTFRRLEFIPGSGKMHHSLAEPLKEGRQFRCWSVRGGHRSIFGTDHTIHDRRKSVPSTRRQGSTTRAARFGPRLSHSDSQVSATRTFGHTRLHLFVSAESDPAVRAERRDIFLWCLRFGGVGWCGYHLSAGVAIQYATTGTTLHDWSGDTVPGTVCAVSDQQRSDLSTSGARNQSRPSWRKSEPHLSQLSATFIDE